jgi:hypothetical protein
VRCSRRNEVRDLLARGHWPEACEAELRAHVAGCRACGEMVMLTQSFRTAREHTAAVARPVPASLVWWRAQLRRRQTAMEQVNRPIWSAQIFAVALSVCAAVGLAVWAIAHGADWNWNFSGMRILASIGSGLGIMPLVMSVAVLAVLGGVLVWLTLERE